MKKVFVGVDVSKKWIDVCVALEDQLLHEQFDNGNAGFRKMTSWLKQFGPLKQLPGGREKRVWSAQFLKNVFLSTVGSDSGSQLKP